MNYEQDEFFELIEAVEQGGGVLLDDLCKAKTYQWSGSKGKPVTLAGCGNQALLQIPYDALDVRGNEQGVHPVVVCAVDDEVGKWPRFGGDRFAEAAA